ncbi:hypothetical protein LCGC14_2959530 [marine sediment metagenome]|uniref:Uncharacterized protein n=1 Tax=marine sediment metagenome TaxID=412755 RepID=A0A0F8XCL7_9ZZZZ
MTQATEKAPPTLAELEGKVQRLDAQALKDGQAALDAGKAFAAAVKSGDVDKAVELADARAKANATLGKTQSQLKTATSAVESATRSQNAGKIADIHTAMASDAAVNGFMDALDKLGCKWTKIERSEETGKLIINSPETAPRKARASSNGGSRGTASWEVDGQSFTSRELIEAHADMLTDKVREHFDSGNFRAFSMTREAERIHGLLTSGN